MNILVWIIQILLGAYNAIGGVFVIHNYRMVANPWALSLPKTVWIVLGILQIVFAAGLVLPIQKGRFFTISAICLAIISLLGNILYITYAGFPGMLWGIIPAVPLAYIAYKRAKLSK